MTNANKKNAQPKYFKPVFAALLAALIVLLTFTIGGLRIGPLTITFNCLPLAVGAIFLGPVYGAILGLVFGLCSFIASFTTGSLTTILLNVNPFLTFLMCVVPRVICGFVPGLIFKHLPKDSETINLLSGAYEEITGEKPELYSTGGGTYARMLGGKGVAFGPAFKDDEVNMHNADESMDEEKFFLHAQICLQAMHKMFTDEI